MRLLTVLSLACILASFNANAGDAETEIAGDKFKYVPNAHIAMPKVLYESTQEESIHPALIGAAFMAATLVTYGLAISFVVWAARKGKAKRLEERKKKLLEAEEKKALEESRKAQQMKQAILEALHESGVTVVNENKVLELIVKKSFAA